MTDIVEFLRARYAEDASVARAAGDGDDLSWAGWQLGGQLEEAGWDYPEAGNREAHVLRHDPAAVLADIDAKLLLVNEHSPRTVNVADFEQFQPGVVICSTCSYPHGESVGADEYKPYPCRTLRLLALPYAQHEHYREEWRP